MKLTRTVKIRINLSRVNFGERFKTVGITAVSAMPRTIEMSKNMGIFVPKKMLISTCVKMIIIDYAKTFSQLKIRESFHIERLKPELNKQFEHVNLSLHF